MAKSTNNKEDFIDKLMSMTDTELNDYIKAHGKKPKLCNMVKIVKKP